MPLRSCRRKGARGSLIPYSKAATGKGILLSASTTSWKSSPEVGTLIDIEGGMRRSTQRPSNWGWFILDMQCFKLQSLPPATVLTFLVEGIPPQDILAAGAPPAPTNLTIAACTLTISKVRGAISTKFSPANAPESNL